MSGNAARAREEERVPASLRRETPTGDRYLHPAGPETALPPVGPVPDSLVDREPEVQAARPVANQTAHPGKPRRLRGQTDQH